MMERIAHYRELAAQFRHWAESETVPEARDGLLDMARQYERLAIELQASAAMAKDRQGFNRSQGAPNWTATMIEHPARKLLRAA